MLNTDEIFLMAPFIVYLLFKSDLATLDFFVIHNSISILKNNGSVRDLIFLHQIEPTNFDINAT